LKNVHIDDAEWNFRPLLDAEVGPCLNYELWREVAATKPNLANRLQQTRERLDRGETFNDDLLAPANQFVPSEILSLARWTDYFPRTPFLKIPRQKRKELLPFEPRTRYSALRPYFLGASLGFLVGNSRLGIADVARPSDRLWLVEIILILTISSYVS
jgi:hypothetical protein